MFWKVKLNNEFYFDGKKLIIPKEMMNIFRFLAEIIQEINVFLKTNNVLIDYMKCIDQMYKKLKENNIDFKYDFEVVPKDLIKELNFNRPSRSEMIVIFCYLETLRCLWTAYNKKTSDEKDLRDASDSSIDVFFKNFCLSQKNEWVKNNSKRSGKIGAKNLRKLRNSLTHFFSVTNLGIADKADNQSEKITKATNNLGQFISSDDLMEIAKGAMIILLKQWNTDYQSDKPDFNVRVECMDKIVEKNGPKFLDLNGV